MDQVLQLLAKRILEPADTTIIRDEFPSLLLLIVTKAFPINDEESKGAPPVLNFTEYVRRCVALSKLIDSSQDIHQ